MMHVGKPQKYMCGCIKKKLYLPLCWTGFPQHSSQAEDIYGTFQEAMLVPVSCETVLHLELPKHSLPNQHHPPLQSRIQESR